WLRALHGCDLRGPSTLFRRRRSAANAPRRPASRGHCSILRSRLSKAEVEVGGGTHAEETSDGSDGGVGPPDGSVLVGHPFPTVDGISARKGCGGFECVAKWQIPSDCGRFTRCRSEARHSICKQWRECRGVDECADSVLPS